PSSVMWLNTTTLLKWRSVRSHLSAVLGPARMDLALPVDAVVGVGAEVVAQALEEVRWPALAAVAVVMRERRREGGHGDATVHRFLDHAAPRVLGRGQGLFEEGREHEVLEVGVL